MMDEKFVQEIRKMADEARNLQEVDGKIYSPVALKRVYSDPRPAPINVYSLQGIVDYLENNIDELDKSKLMIHVVNHKQVDVITHVQGEENERHTVISAILDELPRFPFEKFMDQQLFIIKCRSLFVPTDDMDKILAYTARIETDSAVITEDDGITQKVNLKKGVSGVRTEREDMPAIVKLRPYRTFTEVEQPESDFLFRVTAGDGSAACALFDADGGGWKDTAREHIAEFFSDTGVVVIA